MVVRGREIYVSRDSRKNNEYVFNESQFGDVFGLRCNFSKMYAMNGERYHEMTTNFVWPEFDSMHFGFNRMA